MVAVVDIGATSVRMAIAEISSSGTERVIESLSQPITLGKDTFTQRRISRVSIEQCVNVLKSYRKLLNEYGIDSPDKVRVVATSAVREASNRLAFLDRVYVATGFEVQPLDEAEVNRITYMGIQPLLQKDPDNSSKKSVVIEVGGGSTEVLVVQRGNVLFSHNYRLGTLRLLEVLDDSDVLPAKRRAVLESQILRVVGRILEHVSSDGTLNMIAIGGDVRFAARHLIEDWDPNELSFIEAEALNEFTRKILRMSDDEVVTQYGLNFQAAETVAPALLSYVLLARGFQQKRIAIANTNLRDGLIQDLATGELWTANFRSQIVRSAVGLGRRFDFDEQHARHVAVLSRSLFKSLKEYHGLDAKAELILHLASLLHEIGLYINVRGNHKHAMYLIRNSDLFGLSRRDVLLVSLVVRYHRRSSPMPQHENYANLSRRERVLVSKLAAVLRIAIALDDSRSQRIKQVRCETDSRRCVIIAQGVEDVSLEQLALRQSGNLFQEVFGRAVQLRPAPRET
ncbi:MAG TPA: exopolyphosphatase [Planctomycetaceae bacterium]|nr:exopolyphosphatase [Planctomycetaceae bacterium]